MNHRQFLQRSLALAAFLLLLGLACSGRAEEGVEPRPAFREIKRLEFAVAADKDIAADDLRGEALVIAVLDASEKASPGQTEMLKSLAAAAPRLLKDRPGMNLFALAKGAQEWTTLDDWRALSGDSPTLGRINGWQMMFLDAAPALPMLYVIDGNGRLRHRLSGTIDADTLQATIESALRDSPDGDPMTEHKHTNRLSAESSPYLLQHAHNPVDWYPWGDEAFERARREDKPIFLSIGYSTCHWCHVMERESFENEDIADVLNSKYISIKVDREERPDVDAIYMQATLAVNQNGGWPMSVFLTPDRKPFHAGTYYPPTSAYGRMGFQDLLLRLDEVWQGDRQKAVDASEKLTEFLVEQSKAVAPTDGAGLNEDIVVRAYGLYAGRFDKTYGGFGQAPKFPSSHNLNFLLWYWHRSGEDKALAMVEKTLREMGRGGLYDHIGGGFARYSTDERWLLPHFEKMLYDQAQLARTYADACRITKKPEYEAVLRGVLGYVMRDMTDPAGGFYSAEDADSEGEEGKFYVWMADEIRVHLGEADAKVFIDYYNVLDGGNFSHEAGGHGPTGDNILHLTPEQTDANVAARHKLDVDDMLAGLARSREILFKVREKRVHPLKDDKILSEWNGMMIGAFARAAQALDAPEYAEAAQKSAEFLLTTLSDKDGRLLRRCRQGQADIPGYLDDYAFVSEGLLDLFEATQNPRWLAESLRLCDIMIAQFWNEKSHAFDFSGEHNEEMIAPTRELYDGAYPSGNSTAANVLARLARYTGREDLREKAAKYLSAASGMVTQMPIGFANSLQAWLWLNEPGVEVVVSGDPASDAARAMLRAAQAAYLPGSILVQRPSGDAAAAIDNLVPFVKDQPAVDGKATFYLCENFSCQLPETDVAKAKAVLEAKAAPDKR